LDLVSADKLIDVLNKETAMYEEILKLSKNKTNIIVEGKVNELESLTKLEQSIILKLGILENEREKLLEGLAAQLGIKASDITLSGLEKMLSGEQKEKMTECRQKLPKLLKDLNDANVLNSKLIKNSIDYIDFSINLLTNAGPAGNTYGNSGLSRDSKRKNFFDVKL
jgi:flagellar biosynthesis/type III secretory pathway chaperone